MKYLLPVLVLMLAVAIQHFAMQQSQVWLTLAMLTVAVNLYLLAFHLYRPRA